MTSKKPIMSHLSSRQIMSIYLKLSSTSTYTPPPNFTHFMAINSNMASKRSSQKEAMKPMLNVRESYSAMSFIDAAGGSSRRHQSAVVPVLSPGKSPPSGNLPLENVDGRHQAPPRQHATKLYLITYWQINYTALVVLLISFEGTLPLLPSPTITAVTLLM